MKTILREWRGVIRRQHKDEYVDYIKGTGLDDYRATAGNLGAAIAVRDLSHLHRSNQRWDLTNVTLHRELAILAHRGARARHGRPGNT